MHACPGILNFQHPRQKSRRRGGGQIKHVQPISRVPCSRREQQAHACPVLSHSHPHPWVPRWALLHNHHKGFAVLQETGLWNILLLCASGSPSPLPGGSRIVDARHWLGGAFQPTLRQGLLSQCDILLPSASVELLLFLGVKCWAVSHELEWLYR